MYLICTQYKSEDGFYSQIWWGKHNAHITCEAGSKPSPDWLYKHCNPDRERTITAAKRLPKRMFINWATYELDSTLLYDVTLSRYYEI